MELLGGGQERAACLQHVCSRSIRKEGLRPANSRWVCHCPNVPRAASIHDLNVTRPSTANTKWHKFSDAEAGHVVNLEAASWLLGQLAGTPCAFRRPSSVHRCAARKHSGVLQRLCHSLHRDRKKQRTPPCRLHSIRCRLLAAVQQLVHACGRDKGLWAHGSSVPGEAGRRGAAATFREWCVEKGGDQRKEPGAAETGGTAGRQVIPRMHLVRMRGIHECAITPMAAIPWLFRARPFIARCCYLHTMYRTAAIAAAAPGLATKPTLRPGHQKDGSRRATSTSAKPSSGGHFDCV